jgi:DNA segregation ATPase FtsK/SpoIIIE-like protein
MPPPHPVYVQAQEVHDEVRKWLASSVSQEVADATRILYGGSGEAALAGGSQTPASHLMPMAPLWDQAHRIKRRGQASQGFARFAR